MLINKFIFFNQIAFGQTSNNTLNDIPNIIYYDADDDVIINPNTGYIELNKNATFLLGNVYITASRIIIMQSENIIIAEGNVRFIYNKEKATASKIVIDSNTRQIRMDNAQIFSDPNSTDERVSKEVLGLSKAEIAFDIDRKARSAELENQLKLLRNQYSNLQNLKEINPSDLNIDDKINSITIHYAQILARYSRTEYQPNAYLAAIPEKEKERFVRRRKAVEKFNRENPNISSQIANFNPISGYINVSASEILQKDDQTFLLNNSIITPCHCSPYGEPPIFGFSSKNAKINVGSYITLQGATLDLFSIPLIYAPWFKISIKNKRESGFLMANAYTSNNAGSATTIPYFLTLGDHADSTLTYQYFSQRGNEFEAELRAQFDEDTPTTDDTSQFYSNSRFIQDNTYNVDYENNKALVQQKLKNEPNKSKYDDFIGKRLQSRWFNEENINIPLTYRGSLKINGQFVSDNTFLSDFSSSKIADPTTTVLGDTSSASERFLPQEVDAEYYGNNIVLSIRAQGQQDLFSQSQSNTPMRLPRVEFNLLPARYFKNLIILSNATTLEDVIRPGRGNNQLILPLQSSKIPNPNLIPDNPFLEGKRIYTTTAISIPFPSNNYFNANASVSINAAQYYFKNMTTGEQIDPFQGYLEYNLHTDVPFYSTYSLTNDDGQKYGNITENFAPFIDFSYIPNVINGQKFPTTYDLWYAQDSISPNGKPITTSAYVTVGASTSWHISKSKYIEKSEPIKRFQSKLEPSVANLQILTDVLKSQKDLYGKNSEDIFKISSDINSNKIFNNWAKNELENYRKLIKQEEFNQKYTWPTEPSYKLVTDFNMDPISLSVSTNYNFYSNKTAEEQNQRQGPIASASSPFPVAPFGDINGSLNWSLNPILNLNGGLNLSYSQVYHRIDNVGASINTQLPFGLGLSYTRNIQYVLTTKTSYNAPTSSSEFVEKTSDYAAATYQPLSWLQFGFYWTYSTDPSVSSDPNTVLVNSNPETSYASSYFINLLNIQDCMNIILERNKFAGYTENQATYLIGLNIKLFGYSSKNIFVGDYLNRKIQNQ